MNIGFSTGSLALNDFRRAIDMQKATEANAIELSALRENELLVLLEALDLLNLKQFNYVSFHAPSKLIDFKEAKLIDQLLVLLDRGINIVVHPDIITDYQAWRVFGECLCIENMDKRKPIGQTTSDLFEIFDKIPGASLCFDIAHAKQVDPTMIEAMSIASNFSDKIKQLHVSDVNSKSKHEPLNFEAILAFRKLRNCFSKEIPIIIESPINDQLEIEIQLTKLIFDDNLFDDFMTTWKLRLDKTTGIISSLISASKETA